MTTDEWDAVLKMDQAPDLSTKDQIIAYLLKVIDEEASDGLGAWLADNTEEVFEEEPEIDTIRGNLLDAAEAVHTALEQINWLSDK